jgi:hypothetical protein
MGQHKSHDCSPSHWATTAAYSMQQAMALVILSGVVQGDCHVLGAVFGKFVAPN